MTRVLRRPPDAGGSAWIALGRSTWLALVALLLGSAGGCGEATSPATNAALAPSFPRPREKHDAAPSPSLRIIRSSKPLPHAERYGRSRSVAVVAEAEVRAIAYGVTCWPTLRPIREQDKRTIAVLLGQIARPRPVTCSPEPLWVRAAARRAAQRPLSWSENPPPPLPIAFRILGTSGYAKVAREARAGKLRDVVPTSMERRWMSDVRVQRTGESLIDRALLTVIRDPRFVSAMGRVRVSLVDTEANVLLLRSYQDVVAPDHDAGDAPERLARRVTSGRYGYFPDADEFEDDYPIGVNNQGFTAGDRQRIYGAVCVNIGGRLHPGSPDEADAIHCLLRALGIAGQKPSWLWRARPISATRFHRHFPSLVDSIAQGAFVSDDAFAVLAALYNRRDKSPH